MAWEHERRKLEKEITDLNHSLKINNIEFLTKTSDLNNLNEKYCKLQNLYTDLILEHSNLLEVSRLLEEDIKTVQTNLIIQNQNVSTNNNESESSFYYVARKRSINTGSLKHWPNLSSKKELSLKNFYGPLSDIKDDNETKINTKENNISKENKQKVNRTIIYKSKLFLTAQRNIGKKPHVAIFADSQGRDLSGYLTKLTGDQMSVSGHIQPGAPLEVVLSSALEEVQSKHFDVNDCLVLIGGTNNIINNTFNKASFNKHQFIDFIKSHISKFSRTNLILATIPYRYDLKENDHQNTCIKELNTKLRNIVYDLKNINCNISLLDLNLLTSRQHTRHGLHINRSGKKFIGEQINKMLQDLLKHHIQAEKLSILPQSTLHTEETINNDPMQHGQEGKITYVDLDDSIADGETTHTVLTVARNTLADVVIHRPDISTPKFIRPTSASSHSQQLGSSYTPGTAVDAATRFLAKHRELRTPKTTSQRTEKTPDVFRDPGTTSSVQSSRLCETDASPTCVSIQIQQQSDTSITNETPSTTPLRGRLARTPTTSPVIGCVSQTPAGASSTEEDFQGFMTPKTDKVTRIQELVDKCLELNNEPKNKYFLRHRKTPTKKT